MVEDEVGRSAGQAHAGLQSLWKDFRFRLVCGGKSMEGFEQGVI